ncbi:MAG TPA: VOC family protein [Thermoanaerobaculia bacterium]|nr:VOC family protein [Thermoanaerobaculia bacterium]
MEIRQFRVVVRARSFERTGRFYGEALALPRIGSWEREDLRGALFQAGAGVIEVVARPAGDAGDDYDEVFDYQGPEHKLLLVFQVPSAEQAYDEARFRDPEIPGGLRRDGEGLLFETHDPDGVKIYFRQLD